MTETRNKIEVHIKYQGAEETFSGNAEETWLLLNKFFSQFLPAFNVASKLSLNVDLQALAKESEGLIGFSSEGANVLVPKGKLTDNETLLLWLLANYLGNQLGSLSTEDLSKDELQNRIGKSAKITSTRLGELVKSNMVAKTDSEKFRITTFGVFQIQKEMLPRIKAKI